MKKTITNIVATVFMLALVSSAAGCGEKVKVPEDSQTSVSAEVEGTKPSKPELTSDTSITEYTLASYQNFSEDVAWVKGYDEIWRCINKDGEILFNLEEGNKPVSNFNDGVAVIESDSEYQSITVRNEVVASFLKSDYSQIAYADKNIVSVTKEVNSLEGDVTEYGLFDMSKNEWIEELGESSFGGGYLDFRYFGDGVYLYESSVYDAKNKAHKKDLDTVIRFIDGADLSSSETKRGAIITDSAVPHGIQDPIDAAYIENLNTSDFSTTKIVDVTSSLGVRCLTLSDGIFFLSSEENAERGLYDMNGNSVADFSEYQFYEAWAVDGNLLAILRNPNGREFTTAFDITGEMMFEPIEGQCKHVSDDAFYLNDGFYDLNGNLIVNIEDGFDRFGFQDGVLWTVTTNESGMKQLALIDMNGETLFEASYVY